MKKKYNRPILITAVVYIEDSIITSSIVVAESDNLPFINEEIEQESGKDWVFNID